MFQFPSVAPPLFSKLDSDEFNLESTYGPNFNSVDRDYSSTFEISPQIIDTTLAGYYRQVNFKQVTPKELAGNAILAFGVAVDGTSPDATRPWKLSYSMDLCIESDDIITLASFVARLKTGESLAAAHNAEENDCDPPQYVPAFTFMVQQTVSFYVAKLCVRDIILVGNFVPSLTESDGFRPQFDPDVSGQPVVVGVALVNPKGNAVNVAINQGTITVSKDAGGLDALEHNR